MQKPAPGTPRPRGRRGAAPTGQRDRRDDGRAENQRPRDRSGRPLPYDTDETVLAQEWGYETVEEALAGGVWLWNRQRYFEAHEALEHVWHAASPDDRDFWQGVIQVAVAMVHHQRDNAPGVVTMAQRAQGRLERYPDVYHGVDVEQLRVFCEGVAAAVQDAGACIEIGYPDFPAMDDGPWFDDGAPDHPLPDGPAWKVAADERARTARARDEQRSDEQEDDR